jgi:hypothetical protein
MATMMVTAHNDSQGDLVTMMMAMNNCHNNDDQIDATLTLTMLTTTPPQGQCSRCMTEMTTIACDNNDLDDHHCNVVAT